MLATKIYGVGNTLSLFW